MQYVQDYDERFPAWRYATKLDGNACPSNGDCGWATNRTNVINPPLFPYLKSVQILQCPSELTAFNGTPSGSGFTDYVYNANVGSDGSGGGCGGDSWSGNTGRHLNEFGTTSVTILLTDGPSYGADSFSNGGARCSGGGPARANARWGPTGSQASRHLEGANYVFADGHVKWYQPENITIDATSAGHPTFRVGDCTAAGC